MKGFCEKCGYALGGHESKDEEYLVRALEHGVLEMIDKFPPYYRG